MKQESGGVGGRRSGRARCAGKLGSRGDGEWGSGGVGEQRHGVSQ